VPVGPNIAVVLQVGSSMWGCADVPNLHVGEELKVEVTVIDRPIDLSSTNLDVSLDFKADPGPYGEIIKSAAEILGEAFLPSEPEAAAQALLDAMVTKTPPDRIDAFQNERSAMGWDGIVAQKLAGLPAGPRENVAQWIMSEVESVGDPPAIESQIVGRLTAAGDAPDKALFSVSKLGVVNAADAGIPAEHSMTLTAEPGDSLMLMGTIFWMPSRYAGGLALEGAKKELPSVLTIPEALSSVIDCAGVGADLVGYGMCDAACLASLCEDGLSVLWERGLSASADSGLTGEISLSASCSAEIDAHAAPISLDGKWLGTLSNGAIAVILEGTATAAQPPDVSPEGPPDSQN
jgi:hypothetical protein